LGTEQLSDGALGERKSHVDIDGTKYERKCEVQIFHDLFSGHADQRGLLRFVQAFKTLDTVIITHGNEKSRDALETAIKNEIPGLKIFKPYYGLGFDIKTRSVIPPKESYQPELQVVIAAVLPNPEGFRTR
jgi:Cft2 family RNA processing exonuclease